MYFNRQLFLLIFLALFTSSAFAYLDPNTGGYLFQLLAPLFAIAMSAWMFFSNQVKSIYQAIIRIVLKKTIIQRNECLILISETV